VDPRGCGLGGQPGSTQTRLELKAVWAGRWRGLRSSCASPLCPLAVPSIVLFLPPSPPLSCPHVVFSAVPSCVPSGVPLVPLGKIITRKKHDCGRLWGRPGSTQVRSKRSAWIPTGAVWAVGLHPRGCGLGGRPGSAQVRFGRSGSTRVRPGRSAWIHTGVGRAVCLDPRGCGLGGQPGSTQARLELKCGLGWALECVGGG